jgi:uncharacterized protein
MRVCLDTNVFLRIFSHAPVYELLRQSLIRGRLTIVVSNEILLEYREIVERRSRFVTWAQFDSFLRKLTALGRVVEVSPQFRFAAIPADPDDNKFADCAIAGAAEFVVTHDKHFDSLVELGYKPRAITPEDLVLRLSST